MSFVDIIYSVLEKNIFIKVILCTIDNPQKIFSSKNLYNFL